jgi:hypothetical protein
MARPWPRRRSWPYVAKNGKKSYTVGFYDHDKRERTKAFPTVKHAQAWMDDYVAAERRGKDSLRRFLLDLDAKEASEAEGRSIAVILELFLELDAHPRNEEGLAPATYARYRSLMNRHLLGKQRRLPSGSILRPVDYAVAIAATPAGSFNKPAAPRAWREQMREAGVSNNTRTLAWRVLSSALSCGRPARPPCLRSIQTVAASPRTGAKQATLSQAWWYRLPASRAPEAAASMGALAAGRRSDPRADAARQR